MTYTFIGYPKCSTVKKAQDWLDSKGIKYEYRHIVENNPTVAELTQWIKESGKPVKSFFNTSGLKYKELNLKDKLPALSEAEQIKILATHGMLVKRPLLIGQGTMLVGFKEPEWERVLGK